MNRCNGDPRIGTSFKDKEKTIETKLHEPP